MEHLLPRYSFFVLYRAYVLSILDHGICVLPVIMVHMFCPSLIIYDNCTTADSNLLESVQTAAATLILGCLRTTPHEIIPKELGLTPFLSIVRFTFL